MRLLEVRLRTNWSHCANIDAGPAVMSPNMYKTCIHRTSFNLFYCRENPIAKYTLEVTLRVKGASASSFSTSPLPCNSYSHTQISKHHVTWVRTRSEVSRFTHSMHLCKQEIYITPVSYLGLHK